MWIYKLEYERPLSKYTYSRETSRTIASSMLDAMYFEKKRIGEGIVFVKVEREIKVANVTPKAKEEINA